MGKKSSSLGALNKWSEFITKASAMQKHPMLSLGPLSVNLAVGNPKGLEMGRIVQLVGRASSGKSTLSLDIIRQYMQDYEHPVYYLDFERSLDSDYASSCGVDIERLFRVHPDTTEIGFDILEAILQEGEENRLIVVDSVAASKPSSEEGKSFGDNMKMASSAGLLSRLLPRITPLLDNTGSTVIMINQTRKNFNQMSPETEIPFGGMALTFYTALTIHLTAIKNEETTQTVQALVRKNKKGAPRHRTEFRINYGMGIDYNHDLLSLAEQYGIVQKAGAWYNYGELKAQGALKAIEQFPMDDIRTRILEAV